MVDGWCCPLWVGDDDVLLVREWTRDGGAVPEGKDGAIRHTEETGGVSIGEQRVVLVHMGNVRMGKRQTKRQNRVTLHLQRASII